ncbi:putative tfiiic transcription initiation factor complex subunits tfc3 [Erysiphe neolycopersici]|uniref:Putative tfiiic transcription initiation factor complex subunits tfc3 n=1 Tax=Erysiphe neolycopersici TaxID=212602 RepID=A0A420I101_9PEZI|nr:putative tfiiic transcription initiation factor complex subunits tfc3 [Erysiphe neolycopersici]
MEKSVESTNRNILNPKTLSRNEEGLTADSSSTKADTSSKRAAHKPYEQARYEAGLTGVYINPKPRGSAEPTRGRPVKRPRFAVFRSERLRDPFWLENRRGTWHNYVAEAITTQIIEAENNTQAAEKRKSGEIKKQSSEEEHEFDTKKRKMIKNSDVFIISDQDNQQGAESVSSQNKYQRNENVSLESNNFHGHNSLDTSAVSVPLKLSQNYSGIQNLTSANRRSARTSKRGSFHNEAKSKSKLNNQKKSLGYPGHEQYLNQWTSLDQPNYMAQNLLPKNPYQSSPISSTTVIPSPQKGTLRTEAATLVPISGRVTRRSSGILTDDASRILPTVPVYRNHFSPSKNYCSIVPNAPSLGPYDNLSFQQPQSIHSQYDNNQKKKSFQNTAFQDSETQQDYLSKEMIFKKPRLDLEKKSQSSESLGGGEPDLELAEAIYFPPELDRLICRYQGKAGNLLLSANKQCLEFFSIDHDCSENALFRLEISRIQNHPITSIAGSNPMELRIKAIDQENKVNVHAFEFPSTARASEAASNMRAKIVTGIVACKFRSGEDYNHPVEIQEESQKPYKCESCEKRFKNQNGLEYHLSKAATTCNPNFDPQVGPGKRGRKKRKRTPDPTTENTQPGSVTSPSSKSRYIDHETNNEIIESTNESSAFSSSDDSVIKWATQNSIQSFEKSQRGYTTAAIPGSVQNNQKSYKSLPREAEALSKIVEESTTITSEVKSSFPQVEFANVIPIIADQASPSGTFDMARYESLILSLIKSNNGFFPGDKSIWFACFGAWLKQKVVMPTSVVEATAPESKFCSQLIDDLVESGKLKKYDINFQDKDRRQVSRYFLTIPGTRLNWSLVREAKKMIKENYPDFYVPPQFAPPEIVLSKLRDLTNQSISRSTSCDNSEENINLNSRKLSVSPESDDPKSDQDDAFINNKKANNPKSEIKNLTKSSTVVSQLNHQDWIKNRNMRISEGLRRYHQTIAKNPKKRKTAKGDKTQGDIKNVEFLDNVSYQPEACPVSTLLDLGKVARSNTQAKYAKGKEESLGCERNSSDAATYIQDSNGSWSIQLHVYNIISIYFQSPQINEQNSFKSLNVIERAHNKCESSSKLKVSSKKRRNIQTMDKTKRKSTTTLCQSKLSTVEDVEVLEPLIPENTLISKPTEELNTREQTQNESKSESESESDYDYDIPRVQLKKSTKATEDLREMDILSLYEPKKLGNNAARNPALETLPSDFGVICSVNKSPLHGSNSHVFVKILSPQIIDSQCNFENGSWTVDKFFDYKQDKYNIRFDEKTTYDVETLPYRDLCFALSIKETVPITSYARIQEEAKIAHRKQNSSSRRLKFTRLLTHLNIDFWGIGCRPEVSSKYLGIPMTAGDEIAKLRKRNSHDSMSLMVEKRFIVAVIIIRALTGGIECLTDWVLVSLLFPRFSLNFIRGHWKQLVVRHKKAIDRLEIDFQNAFVPAYESGKIQKLDYDHLQDYNWNKLVDWTMNTIDTSFNHKPVSIPSTRNELRSSYTLEISDTKDNWRDKCFETNAAIYRRLDYACFNALVMPIKNSTKTKSESESELTELTLARSWIRALAISPESQSLNKTNQKFSKKIGEKALSDLIESKVIMYRSKKRVNLSYSDYEATELFSRPLRREVKPKCFRDASVFKRYLDSEFRSGKSHVRVDYMAWDGDVMVISNLQAHNRIQLHAIDVPREKFGLTEGGYETKKIPRERLRFEMDIYPTSTYIYDDENIVVLKALNSGPPRGKQSAIPVWYNTSETVVSTMWKEVYSAVAQVIAFRAGVNIQELTRIFTPTMEEWEIRLLLAWGEEIGLFCRLHEKIDGWIAGEWWWAYAMSLFANDRFTAGQDVRYEPKNPFTMEGRRET